MNKVYYIVAEHLFCVEAQESVLGLLGNYEPFRTEQSNDALFSLTVADGWPIQYIEEPGLAVRLRDGWFVSRDTAAVRFT